MSVAGTWVLVGGEEGTESVGLASRDVDPPTLHPTTKLATAIKITIRSNLKRIEVSKTKIILQEDTDRDFIGGRL